MVLREGYISLSTSNPEEKKGQTFMIVSGDLKLLSNGQGEIVG